MRLVVEFDSDEEARRAVEDLKHVGFHEEKVDLSHPMDGGTLLSLVAWGERLAMAFEVLREHDARPVDEPPRRSPMGP